MTIDSRPRARVRGDGRLLVVSGALGLLAGAAAKAADESGWRWAADLGSYPAAWVLAVALVGRYAPTVGTAAGRSAAFFAAMTVAYYAWAAWALGFGWSPLLPVWLVLSATVVAAFAATTWWAGRKTGPLPAAAIALAAAVPLAGGEFAGLWSWIVDAPSGFVPVHPVQGVVDAAVALALLVVLPCTPRTRLWAVLLVVPATAVAGRLLDALRTVTG
ncbi:hypothetical protein [Blastococcus tunisiensis]|uniref:Uncharacterized protein n=1 Tax=Blastococcus tunisiensis TaxID=1798228 RepID=A0A1I2I389_9ACTN|nr:hypothetical protein [Blastococcus sp. DSM 46838]SFF36083.1 hypothetical protein SAMN05216574_11255 [Blastococcus sp. DSM 46838]